MPDKPEMPGFVGACIAGFVHFFFCYFLTLIRVAGGVYDFQYFEDA